MIQNKSNSENDLTWDEIGVPASTRFNDPYFSRDDGRAETEHVFINGNRLPNRWPKMSVCTIAELGFGTGLNFLETVRQWNEIKPDGAQLNFVSFEQFPIKTDDMRKALSQWPELDKLAAKLGELWKLEFEILEEEFSADIRLVVFMSDANVRLPQLELAADAWYLDGFAPSRNPELWNEELIRTVFEKTAPGGTFATYSCAGFVRRNLLNAGFTVEKQHGFGAKREMLSGQKAP